MKKHLLASVGLMALMAAGSANAADMPVLKAPPPPAWSWSGLYLGAHGGYGWGRDPQSDNIFGSKTAIGDISSRGYLFGFQAGANWQSGAWVGGLEIDLSGTGISGSSSNAATFTVPDEFTAITNSSGTDKFDLLGSARARFGFLPLPNLLIYGTAGPAWTRFTKDTHFSLFEVGLSGSTTIDFTSSSPSWRFGLAAGAGIESRLGDSNWLGRVEYLHYDFGDSGSSSPDTSFGVVSSGRLTADVVRAGVSYKLTQTAPGAGYAMAMPVKAAPAAPWTWSGFYLGAHAGYGWGRDPTDQTDTGTINSNGAIGGFQAGANWQSGAFVGGLEIDASASGIKGSVVERESNGDTNTDELEWLSTARARVGYLVMPGTLIYGTGGAAWTRLTQTIDEDTTPFWEFGWVVGAGAETRLGATNWLARIEYLHYDFGDSGSSTGSGGTSASGRLTADVVRGALSYKLDWSGAGPAGIAMPLKAPPAAAAWSWDGFYIGGHGGYGWGRDPISDAFFGQKFAADVPRTGINSQGFVAGFQAGANWQMGGIVAGLETDLSATGIKGSTTNAALITDTDKFDTLGSARARLGYLAWPNMLLYGTGGVAWTRLNQTNVDSAGFGNSTPVWEFGWVAGAGGETRLWDSNWLLRLEYLHYDFGDSGSFSLTTTTIGSGPPSGTGTQSTGNLTADVVRAGLSYKFR